ncbi:MAG TPA: lysozyme inhibitor LprI family protein, partial [Luteolibacter sp.]
MKLALLATIGLLAHPLRAEDGHRYVTVPCGKEVAVLYKGSESPAKHYALGWTIRPLTNDARAVDWGKFEKEGRDYLRPEEFLFEDGYYRDDVFIDKKKTHQILIGLIDQRSKSFKTICDTDPPDAPLYGWHDLIVRWIDEQHALILIDAKWATAYGFFVSTASDPLKVTRCLPQMNQRVFELLDQKRPLASSMVIQYGKNGKGEVSKCKVKNGVLYEDFTAYVPKGNGFDDIEGHLLISVKDGQPIKAVSDEPADQPFVGELGEADRHLNEIYGQLRKQLPGGEFKNLKANQKKWISERNNTALRNAPGLSDGGTREHYLEIRNREALKLTR